MEQLITYLKTPKNISQNCYDIMQIKNHIASVLWTRTKFFFHPKINLLYSFVLILKFFEEKIYLTYHENSIRNKEFQMITCEE